MKIRAIEHMAIAGQNTAQLAKWYVDMLGFEVVVDGGEGPRGTWFVGPAEGQAVIEIVPVTEAPRAGRARNDPGWSHLAFTVDDFDSVCEHLKANGVRFDGTPSGTPGDTMGRRLAFFLDPEDNVLQIVQRPEPLRP